MPGLIHWALRTGTHDLEPRAGGLLAFTNDVQAGQGAHSQEHISPRCK